MRHDLQSSQRVASQTSSSGGPAVYQTSPPSSQPEGPPWALARLTSLPAACRDRRKRRPTSRSPPPLRFLIEFPLLGRNYIPLWFSLQSAALRGSSRWSRRKNADATRSPSLSKRLLWDGLGIVRGCRKEEASGKSFFFSTLLLCPVITLHMKADVNSHVGLGKHIELQGENCLNSDFSYRKNGITLILYTLYFFICDKLYMYQNFRSNIRL